MFFKDPFVRRWAFNVYGIRVIQKEQHMRRVSMVKAVFVLEILRDVHVHAMIRNDNFIYVQ